MNIYRGVRGVPAFAPPSLWIETSALYLALDRIPLPLSTSPAHRLVDK